MYHLQRGSEDLWGIVYSALKTSIHSSAWSKRQMGCEWLLGKIPREEQTTLLSCWMNSTCASDLHMVWSFVHAVSENIMGAMKGQEEGIWEPRYGWALFKKSLSMTGKKTTERAVIKSSMFMNKSESRETVDAASHNWKMFKDFFKSNIKQAEGRILLHGSFVA